MEPKQGPKSFICRVRRTGQPGLWPGHGPGHAHPGNAPAQNFPAFHDAKSPVREICQNVLEPKRFGKRLRQPWAFLLCF